MTRTRESEGESEHCQRDREILKTDKGGMETEAAARRFGKILAPRPVEYNNNYDG